MKKHLQVIFVLIIYCLLFCFDDVFASPSLTDFNILDSNVGSLGLINQDKLSNQQIDYQVNTDFTTNSTNSTANFILINISLNSYYLYTNDYSQDWTDTDNVLLQTTTATSTSAPSSYVAGQIACKIQHNYASTTATTTAMSCNYLGKNYVMELQNKSHYREHEYDYEQIMLGVRAWVDYSDTSTTECDIVNGQYLLCQYKQNKTISKISIRLATNNSNLFLTSRINGIFKFLNKREDIQNQIINNTDTSPNSSDFSNTVNNFSLPNNSHAFDILGGLQGLINGLQPTGSCSRISVPIPFTDQTFILPCMTTDVYSVHFAELVVIWQLLVRGIVYYYILVNILRLVKETIDPFNFKLEVMDL